MIHRRWKSCCGSLATLTRMFVLQALRLWAASELVQRIRISSTGLVDLLADPDAKSRAGSEQALAALGSLAPSNVLAPVIRLLYDKESSVRNAGLLVLKSVAARVSEVGVVEQVASILQDSDASIRVEALDVLRQFLRHGCNEEVKSLAAQAIVDDWTSKSKAD